MPRSIEPTDEYILAAFLSGDLPDRLRREIITYLTGSDQARDILAMARDALDSLESGDGAPVTPSREARVAAARELHEALNAQVHDRTVWKVTALFASAVLVLALIVMFLVAGLPRTQVEGRAPEWTPHVEGADLQLTWSPLEAAASYQILRFDPDTQQAAVIETVTLPRVDLGSLGEPLSGRLWVLAFDDQGQLLRQSEPVALTHRNP